MNQNLPALVTKIFSALAVRSSIFIIHPAELRILRAMTDDELDRFARERGWSVVRRVGGRQIEFYNDASTRTGSDSTFASV